LRSEARQYGEEGNPDLVEIRLLQALVRKVRVLGKLEEDLEPHLVAGDVIVPDVSEVLERLLVPLRDQFADPRVVPQRGEPELGDAVVRAGLAVNDGLGREERGGRIFLFALLLLPLFLFLFLLPLPFLFLVRKFLLVFDFLVVALLQFFGGGTRLSRDDLETAIEERRSQARELKKEGGMGVSSRDVIGAVQKLRQAKPRIGIPPHLPLELQAFFLVLEHQGLVVALNAFECEHPLLRPTRQSFDIPAALAHEAL